jgi:hypothetical protein
MSKETIITAMTGSISLEYVEDETEDELKQRLDEQTRVYLAGLFNHVAVQLSRGATRIPFFNVENFTITLTYEEEKWDGRYILRIAKDE